jgi:hypothetical protein
MITASLRSSEVRDLLVVRALSRNAVEDAVTELLFEHVVGGRYERAGVAGLLRLRIQGVLHSSTGDDWQAIAAPAHD